jgi:hypothetical protein
MGRTKEQNIQFVIQDAIIELLLNLQKVADFDNLVKAVIEQGKKHILFEILPSKIFLAKLDV